MKTRHSIFVAGLLLLCAAISMATPNFTGEWKMDASKSDFGQMPPPSSVIKKITHEDPSLKDVTTWIGDKGEMTIDAAYTTDGKECANKSPMGESKSTLKWDGDTLVIETKADFQGNTATITSRWTLSEDGKPNRKRVRYFSNEQFAPGLDCIRHLKCLRCLTLCSTPAVSGRRPTRDLSRSFQTASGRRSRARDG